MLSRGLVGLTVLSLALPASAWDGPTHERIATMAMRLMPPYFAAQLEKHRDALVAAAKAPDLASPPEQHRLLADGSGGTLDQEAAKSVAAAVAVMNEQRGFEAMASELGRLSHLVADAAFPLNTSAADARVSRYYADYTDYAGRKLDRFPPIFDGYVSLEAGFDPAAYVRSIAERANRAYPIVASGYFPGNSGAMTSSRNFDDRGPIFGVTQLAYVHAVSATANLWLHVWRESHGDLAGTPHYPISGSAPLAPNRSRAAQRP